MPNADDVLLVACMKDEGPFVLEWVAYYQSIGVGRFIVVTNDCTDGTDALLDRLDEMGIVRHLPNPIMIEPFSKPIQTVALKYAALQKEFREAGWILILDADEFLNLRPGEGTIPELLACIGDVDAISFNQVVFGNSSTGAFLDEPVALQFNRRFRFEGVDPLSHSMMYGLKTLARNRSDLFSRFPNHRPRLRDGARAAVRWVDGSGRPLHPSFFEHSTRSYPVFVEREKDGDGGEVVRSKPQAFPGVGSTHDLGYVNHYALRSLESFIVQSLRGDAVSPKVRRDFGYWRSYDRNQVEDRSIHPRSLRSRPWLDALLSDARLRGLHAQAVDRHRRAYASVARTKSVRDLIEQCRAAFPAREDPAVRVG